MFLKQSTAADVKLGPFVDDADGKTAETGLTIAQADIRLSKAGAAFAQTNNSAGATHDENGYYQIPLDTTDTNTLGRLRVSVSKTGALPVWQDFLVVPAMVYDTLVAGTDYMDSQLKAADANSLTASALATDAVTEIVAAIFNAILTGATYNIKNSAGRLIRQAAGGGQVTLDSGTVVSGAATTVQLATSASAVNDVYNGCLVAITSGPGAGQARRIIDYVGSTRTATVDKGWVVNPDGTSTYEVYADTTQLFSDEGTALAGGATSIGLATSASTTNDIYNGSFITILSGTGSGQTRTITDYDGATRTATVAAWDVQPSTDSIYAVIPAGTAISGATAVPPSVNEINSAVWAGYSASALYTSMQTVVTQTASIVGIKKNTELANFMFFLASSADHVSPVVGATVVAKRSIDGAAFGNCANAAAEIGNGVYKITLAASDLNGTLVALRFSASGADDTLLFIKTQA